MRRAMIVVAFLIGAYLLVCLLAFLFQSRLVYFPDRTLAADPSAVGLAFETVTLEAEDGPSLHGWWIPAEGTGRTLLFFHGNAGNISHRLESVLVFHRLGLSVLLFDYRGYGRSEGSPNEEGTYADARAAWSYLTGERGLRPSEIVLFGRSLGAAVAAELAGRVRPSGVIFESAFPSVPDLGARVYPWLPVGLLARIRYDTAARVENLRCPKLFVHSRGDDIVPFALGLRLFERAAEPKRLLEIRGTHNDGFLVSGKLYTDGLETFFGSLPPAP
jgi:fermentation-respiration switch protein FrsA (DUF1100 family)